MTSTGVELSVLVPSPSWPLKFLPQHFIAPPVSRAHEWSPAWPFRARLVAVEIPDTSTAVVLSVVVPSPSWP
jgi:hypothetical protein